MASSSARPIFSITDLKSKQERKISLQVDHERGMFGVSSVGQVSLPNCGIPRPLDFSLRRRY